MDSLIFVVVLLIIIFVMVNRQLNKITKPVNMVKSVFKEIATSDEVKTAFKDTAKNKIDKLLKRK